MRTTGEKVVVIIGVGLAIATVSGALTWFVVGEILEPSGGWFAYAPDAGPVLGHASSDRGWAAGASVLISLVAIALWVAVSLSIWRGPHDPSSGEPQRFLDRMRKRP